MSSEAGGRKLSKKAAKAEAFKSKDKKGKSNGNGKGKDKALHIAQDLPTPDLLDDDADADGQEKEDGEEEAESVMKSTRKKTAAKQEKLKLDDERGEKAEGKSKKDKKSKKKDKADKVEEAAAGPAAGEDKKEKNKDKKKRKAEEADGAGAAEPAKGKSKSKTKTETTFTEDGEAVTATEPAGEADEGKASSSKKRKRSSEEEDEEEAAEGSASASASASKYILFVGNMSFTTTSEEIASHFSSHCGEEPTVRLLTSKPDAQAAEAALAALSKSKRKSIVKGKAALPAELTQGRSKGCAFVEFASASALQKALQFHHTMLGGRQINVELTAGGGGKTEKRMEKIKNKNEKLEKERQKLHEKYVKPGVKSKHADGEDKAAEEEGAEPAAKKRKPGELDQYGEGVAQWGARGRGGGAAVAAAAGPPAGEARKGGPKGPKQGKPGKGAKPYGGGKFAKKGAVPKWMASGANAVRLQDV